MKIIRGEHGRPYVQCQWCGKLVRVTGAMAGWHVCSDDNPEVAAELARIERERGKGWFRRIGEIASGLFVSTTTPRDPDASDGRPDE